MRKTILIFQSYTGKNRELFLPKWESGWEPMKWDILFHNETIINKNDELENMFSYQPCHLL